jgi:hypothetical protein
MALGLRRGSFDDRRLPLPRRPRRAAHGAVDYTSAARRVPAAGTGAGIDRTVVVPTFTSRTQGANLELAAIVRAHAGRLIGFAWVHPKRDAGRVDDLVREESGSVFAG